MKITFSFLVLWAALQSDAAVLLERIPGGGLQPQVVSSSDGTLHLVSLVGDPKSADVEYRSRGAGATHWSDPMRVNSQPGSAVAIGTIRGVQIALGHEGRVHVVWNGSQSAEPKPSSGGSPMLYSRLDSDFKRFTPQRDLMTASDQLDGGGSIAADREGRVFVFWHGAPLGKAGETNRAVFLALSTDNGLSFAAERPINPPASGACGCCGLTASTNPRGDVFVLFRSARTLMERDMTFLASVDHGDRFTEIMSDPWLIGSCPMSSASLTGDQKIQWAAWETAGRIQVLRGEAGRWGAQPRTFGPTKGAKHPRLATNQRGETLVVWTEGTGWQRGGALAWQVLDSKGEPTAEKGKQAGLPAWDFAAPIALANGDFAIVY